MAELQQEVVIDGMRIVLPTQPIPEHFCPICMELIVAGSEARCEACGQQLHAGCLIATHAEGGRACPLCRADMIIEGYTVGGRFVRPLTRGLAQHYLSSFTVIQRTTRSFRDEGWFSAGGAHPEPQELADFIRGAAAMEQDVVSTVRHIVEYETTLAENEHDAAVIENRLLFLEDRVTTYTARATRLRHRWLGATRAVAGAVVVPAAPIAPVTAPPGLFTYEVAILQPGATGAEWMGQGRRTRTRH